MWRGDHKTSDFLEKRHPYREKTFQQRLRDIKYEIFDGYGDDCIERNVVSLKDDNFSSHEKTKSMVILLKRLVVPENIVKSIDFGIVDSLIYILNRNDEVLNSYCCKLVESISRLDIGCKTFYRQKGFLLLEKVLNNVESRTQKDRNAACCALLMICRSFENCKLLWKNKKYTIIKSLIEILDQKKSKANSRLLNTSIECLTEICRNPEGRTLSASQKIVDYLGIVFSRRNLGYRLNMQKLLTNTPALQCTRSACLLLWNVCLDGKGKKLSKNIIKTACLVLEKSIEVKDIESIRMITGSLTSICIFEEAKPIALENIEENRNMNTAQVLCELLKDLKSENRKLYGKKGDNLSTAENIEKNTVLALRAISKYPLATSFISKCVKDNDEVYDDIFN